MVKIERDPRLMALAKQFLEIYEPASANDVYDSLKKMLGGTIASMHETEMDDHLGFPKGIRADQPENTRNGFSKKNVKSTGGPIEVNIPHDVRQDGAIVKKTVCNIVDDTKDILGMWILRQVMAGELS